MKSPNESAEKKLEIDRKLEREINKLKTIREYVQESNQITKGIQNILSSFEARLGRLEETILPVYNETESLQRRQSNIEKTLTALDQVISYYSAAEEVDSIVRDGPSTLGFSDYLIVLDKLKNALNYFEKDNPQSVERENVSALFNIGVDNLTREFKEILLKHSKPVSPITLLDMVASPDEECTGSDDLSVGSSTGGFTEAVSSDLGLLSNWLLKHGNDEVLTIYAKTRGQVVLKSIQLLKEHHKSGSGSSVHNLSQGSPSTRPKFAKDISGRKTSKKLQAVFEKKANKMLLKASQTLENSTGLSLGSRRSGLNLESREDMIDEHEMDSYLVTVIAVQKLGQIERSIMGNVIPSAYQNKVFQNIIEEALDLIVIDGENIAIRARRCISKKDFGSMLVIFPILRHLLVLKPEFEKTMEGCDYSTRSQFTTIFSMLLSTTVKALEEVVDGLRSDNSGLPKDGTVHEVTSNTLVLIAHLVDYTDTISEVLAGESSYTSALSQLPTKYQTNPQMKANALISIYIKKVLSELNCTLVSKSDGYTDSGCRALFRLNNTHHVLKTLQRSNLLSILQISEPDSLKTYLEMINAQKKNYQQCWNKVLLFISPIEDVSLTPGKLRDKDRSVIKEKFAGFNKEIEEISKLQRSYSVPDVELRESLKRDNKEYILPKYNSFYDKYASLPFTKNLEKYVKYSPEQVASMIDRFFDEAA